MNIIQYPFPSIKRIPERSFALWLILAYTVSGMVTAITASIFPLLFGVIFSLLTQALFAWLEHRSKAKATKEEQRWMKIKREMPKVSHEIYDWVLDNDFRCTMHIIANEPGTWSTYDYHIEFDDDGERALFEIAHPGILKRSLKAYGTY